MGKITYALILMALIDISLFMFAGTTYGNNTVTSLILDPSNIFNSPLYLAIFGIITAVTLATIVASAFIQFNSIGAYGGFVVAMITFVSSAANLWGFVNGQFSTLNLDGGFEISKLVASILVGPIIIYYLVSCVEWMRAN